MPRFIASFVGITLALFSTAACASESDHPALSLFETHIPPLVIVLAAACAASLLSEWTRQIGVSIIVLELLLGVAIGPSGLHWAAVEGLLPTLAAAGMGFLFFLAGFEIQLEGIRGQPIKLALRAWLVIACLAALLGFASHLLGVFEAWLIVAISLSTTALGIVVPILKDSGQFETDFGRLVMAAGVVGELGPILAMALLLSHRNNTGIRLLFVLIFIVIVVLVAFALLRGIAIPKFLNFLERTLTQTSQLAVRMAVFLLVALSVLAEDFGLDLALGALAAGLVVKLATRHSPTPLLHQKMEGIGYGFLVPVFFVTSGMKLDVQGAFSAQGVFRMLLFIAALLAVHLPMLLIARRVLAKSESLALYLYSATTLSLIVAMTDVAVSKGAMKPAEASILVVSGVISVLVLPLLAALVLRGKDSPMRFGVSDDKGGL
jgi:Kef-type K+ transport system membrane component KefB